MSLTPSDQSTPWRYIRLTIPARELRPGDIVVRWYAGQEQDPCDEVLWPVIHVSHEDAGLSNVECRWSHVVEWKDDPLDLVEAEMANDVRFAKDELVDVMRQFNTEKTLRDEIARTSIRATEP